MKVKFSLIFAIIISITSLSAEFDVFQIALGSNTEDYANSIMQTPDNGFIIAGWTTGFGAGSYDAYAVKIDSVGELEWSKTYGGPYADWFRSGYCTDDGGYIFLGTFESNVSTIGNLFLVKTDASGNQEWKKKIGGSSWDDGWCVQQTDDGGYILSGFSYSYSPSNGLHSYIVKTSSLGIVEWTKSVGPSNLVSNTRFIRQTSDGGFIVSGSIGNYSLSSTDMLLYKMDDSGNVQWYKTYGETGTSWGYCAKETSDNGFISVGYSNDYGAGQNDIMVVKTDSVGELEWSKIYGGTGNDYGMSVIENDSGEFVITGFSNSFSNSNDVVLFKIDNLGNVIWTKSYGGNSSDGGEVIIGTMSIDKTNNGYVFAGFTQSYGAGYRDFYITKTDENGFSGNEEEIEFLTEDITPTIEDPTYSLSSGGISVNANNSTSNPNPQVEIICNSTIVGIENDILSFAIPEQTGDTEIDNTTHTVNIEVPSGINISALTPTIEISEFATINPESGTTQDFTEPFEYTVSAENGDEQIWIVTVTILTSSDDDITPSVTKLNGNYPNPFNPTTTISFSVSHTHSFVNIEIYNLKGQKVKTLINKQFAAGQHSVVWNGKDDSNKPVSSGIYFYKMKAGKYTGSGKMILIK